MKHFLKAAVLLAGVTLVSCSDIGGGDPLDQSGGSDGGTLYIRPDPDQSGVTGETGLELRKDL